jgi:hypothetical protein
LNRASRTGPFCVMNHGTLFFAPFKVATAIKGFCASACVWLRVARQTLVGVESGTEPVVRAFGHDLDISEPRLPILEERSFVCSETLQWSAGTRRATAHAWVYRS